MSDNDNPEVPSWPRKIVPPGNRPELRVLVELWDALNEKYADHFFRRGSTLLLRLRSKLEEVSVPRLAALLPSAAEFVNAKGKRVKIDKELVSKMVHRPELRCREILGVVTSPYLAPDLTIVTERGYNAETKLWLEPASGLGKFEPMNLRRALDNLEPLLAFPFATPADRVHALGLYLLLLVRPAIDGPTPMHLISGVREGSGKTYLARCAHLLATGQEPSVRSLAKWEDEASRQLVAALAEIPSFLLLDNLPTGFTLGWSDLHRMVSAHGLVPIRLVGAGREVIVPIRCVWVATANNADVDPEQARRTVPICLLPGGGAKADSGEAPHVYILRNRTLLVASLFRLVKEWIRHGCPTPTRTLPGFGEWSDIVGGIVSLALGDEHWLSIEHRPNPGVVEDWLYLFKVWPMEAGTNGRSPMKPAGVAKLVEDLTLPVLGEAIDAGVKGRANATKMGKLLTDLVKSGRNIGGFVMHRKMNRNGWVYWPEAVAEAQRT
ncbi:MAG: hypothetical protein V4850_30555 [Myxococcota bacterium]